MLFRTLIISSLGLPISFFQLYGDYINTTQKTCEILVLSQLLILHISKIILVALVAVMSLTRYLDVSESRFAEYTEHTGMIIAATVI